MKRAATRVVLLGCALAGALLAVVTAAPSPAGILQTTSTGVTTTTTPTTTTPPPPPPVPVIADGVRIGGVEVGGLTPDAAAVVVRTAFRAPLVLVFQRRRLQPTPQELGATAQVQRAVDRARRAAPGTRVPLVVRARSERVRAYLAKLARRFARKPGEARLFLRRLLPFITSGVPGRRLDRTRAFRAIVSSLVRNRRFPIALASEPVRPTVDRGSFGAVIVIRRGSNRLYLYDGMRLRRVFGVATGAARYPTPLGRFSIVVKWRHPWWYPPNSDWARGKQPIPPGPGNPLGTRWMGLSAPGVGIHGTPDAASIGYSVSHGCIRMRIPDAEWLFTRVSIGTTVFIVHA